MDIAKTLKFVIVTEPNIQVITIAFSSNNQGQSCDVEITDEESESKLPIILTASAIGKFKMNA